MEDFPLDGVEPARAAKRPVIFLFHVASGEPVGPLPAELLAEHGAFLPHALVARRGLQGARGGALLVRVVDDEDMGVGLLVLLEQIIPIRVGPEPARLHAQHVYGGLPFDDPFRQLPTGAAGRGDAEAVAFAQPEVFQPPSGADDGIAIRRVGDGPVIDLLDAALGKGRDAVHGGFDMGFQPLQVFLEQFVFRRLRRAVHIATGRVFLIGSQYEALVLLAHVPRAVRLPQHPHLRQALLGPGRQLRVGFRDDVLMLDGHHRNVQPHHGPGLARVVAGGGNDMLAQDVALVGLHPPLPAARARYAPHPGVAVDLRALGPGPLGQGLGQIRGLHIAVLRVVEGPHQALRVAKGPEGFHLPRRQELHGHADGAGGGGVLEVLVHALLVHGETDVAHRLEAHRLAGFSLQLGVELDRVLVELPHAVAHVEQRQQAGGMPGGAGGQLPLFHQRDLVPPAFMGQVVQGADPDHPAAYDHCPGVCFHACYVTALREAMLSGGALGGLPRERLRLVKIRHPARRSRPRPAPGGARRVGGARSGTGRGPAP